MTRSTALNAEWLTSQLANLGTTGDEVADTLRKAGVKGTPTDIWHDPVAVYIGVRVRQLVPPDTAVQVAVTTEEIVVNITSASDPDGPREISAITPDPVEDLLDRFDALEDYLDLFGEPGV